jgi:hypothetical protein
VIEGGRTSKDWQLLEMLIRPAEFTIDECREFRKSLAPRGRETLRLAGGVATSKALLGSQEDTPTIIHKNDGGGSFEMP